MKLHTATRRMCLNEKHGFAENDNKNKDTEKLLLCKKVKQSRIVSIFILHYEDYFSRIQNYNII